MLPKELKLLETPLAWFQLQPSWATLLRISLWTMVFLGLASLVLPEPVPVPSFRGKTADPNVHMMLTDSTDPNWAMDAQSHFPADELSLVWVSGSSGKLATPPPYSFLADEALTELRKGGRPASGYLYYLESARVVNIYAAVQDAIRRKPDVMVIDIDPLWVYNPWSVFKFTSVFNAGSRYWWNAHDWPLQFLFVSPRNHLWGLGGKYVPRSSLRRLQNWYQAEHVSNSIAGSGGGLTQGITFWVQHRPNPKNTSGRHPEGINYWQEQALERVDTDPKYWGPFFVENLFNLVDASGIPTVIYISPVADEALQYDAARAAYMAVQNAVAEQGKKHANDHLQVVTKYPDKIRKSFVHADYIHLRDAGLFTRLLAQRIVEVVGSEEEGQ